MKLNRLSLAIATAALSMSSVVGAQSDDIEEVFVTGTRIKTPNLQSTNPIVSIDSEAISYSGNTSLQEIVSEVGALIGSDIENEVSNGENALNLRNLGANRTLVLVDGQRFVSGFSGSSAVDVNAIPLAMIERVDVLTGGASAIYGADAVTGVVNFILKRDFEGFDFSAQYGDAFDGDFKDEQYSFTAGKNFANGRGNFVANYTYGKRPLVKATAREQASSGVHQRINNINGSSTFTLAPGTREAFFTEGGARIDPFGIFSQGFNGDGTPFVHGENVGSFGGTGEIGGDGIPNWLLFAQAIRPQNERQVLTLKSHFDVSDRFRPYTSLVFADVENKQLEQHSLTVGSNVARDNAFLPASVLEAAGVDGGPPIYYNHWDLDAGFLDYTIEKKTYRFVIGAEGDLSDTWRYDVSFNHGRSRSKTHLANNRFYDRYLAAVDAVRDTDGNIVCRSSIEPGSFNGLVNDFIATNFDAKLGAVTFTPGANSGCVPYNPFTKDNAANQAAIDWIWQPTMSKVNNKQTVFSAYVAGDTSDWFSLPAGPAELVLGFEYRKEQSASLFDEYSSSSRNVTWVDGANLEGEYDVKEIFFESAIPIFNDMKMPGALELNLAARLSDYSTIGRANTYNAGFTWNDLFSGFMLRGTYSQAVRAPNVAELFEARSNISISLPADPCSIDNINLGSSTRAANCAQALTALGVDPTTFSPLLGTFFSAVTGGNPDLKEEVADTFTLGFVWQPSFVDGLTFSLDYYDIEIDDAIISPGQEAIFNACYDSPTLDNVFCSLIGRDPTTGAANFVEIESVNVAKIVTSGYEFGSEYQFDAGGAGTFRTTLNATYLDSLDVQKSALPVLEDDKGLFNTDTGGASPEWVANFNIFWNMGDFDANYSYNYISKVLRAPLINEQRSNAYSIIDDPYVDAYQNHDLQFGYSFKEASRVYLGIRNLTDEYPDKVHASLNGSSGRQGYAGRTYYMGVNYRFGM